MPKKVAVLDFHTRIKKWLTDRMLLWLYCSNWWHEFESSRQDNNLPISKRRPYKCGKYRQKSVLRSGPSLLLAAFHQTIEDRQKSDTHRISILNFYNYFARYLKSRGKIKSYYDFYCKLNSFFLTEIHVAHFFFKKCDVD